MKKTDIILLTVITIIALIGLYIVKTIEKNAEVENGVAYVMYKDQPILEITLADGSYDILMPQYVHDIDDDNFIYIVTGTNGPVTIEYAEGSVRVIDETSPRNICQDQGWTNNPTKPITCLPNDLIIIIRDDTQPQEIDGWG